MYRYLVHVCLIVIFTSNNVNILAIKGKFTSLRSIECTFARRARIIDGDEITIKQAPYQVSIIEKDKGHVCGGSIISKNNVLTAGHCADSGPSNFTVRSGSSYSNKDGAIHNVTRVIRHEDFYLENGVNRPVNDVALLKVEPSFVLDGVTESKIELVDKNDEVRTADEGLLTGWGATDETTGTASEQLMSVKLQVMDYKECRSNYAFLEGEFPINNFCAKHPSGNKNSCQGDSGGPLVIKGKQAGIVSWGPPWQCTLFGLPSVYLDVAKYRDWIDSHINNA